MQTFNVNVCAVRVRSLQFCLKESLYMEWLISLFPSSSAFFPPFYSCLVLLLQQPFPPHPPRYFSLSVVVMPTSLETVLPWRPGSGQISWCLALLRRVHKSFSCICSRFTSQTLFFCTPAPRLTATMGPGEQTWFFFLKSNIIKGGVLQRNPLTVLPWFLRVLFYLYTTVAGRAMCYLLDRWVIVAMRKLREKPLLRCFMATSSHRSAWKKVVAVGSCGET